MRAFLVHVVLEAARDAGEGPELVEGARGDRGVDALGCGECGLLGELEERVNLLVSGLHVRKRRLGDLARREVARAQACLDLGDAHVGGECH